MVARHTAHSILAMCALEGMRHIRMCVEALVVTVFGLAEQTLRPAMMTTRHQETGVLLGAWWK